MIAARVRIELQREAIGFTRLYPSFASVSLFVAPGARRCGAGAALLRAAVHYASGQGASEPESGPQQ
jgi:GNAT superfamily N-acetyltransferase